MSIALPEETKTQFCKLVSVCKEVCPDCVFSLVDSEGDEVWCSLPETLLKSMEGWDEMQYLEVWENSKRLNKVAWFGIMPYEPDGVCWNYGGNEIADKIFERFTK